MSDIPEKKIVAPTAAAFEAMAAAAKTVKSTPASVGKTKVSAAVADLMAKATADATNTKTTILALRPPEIKKNTLAEALVALKAAAEPAVVAMSVRTTAAAAAATAETVQSPETVVEVRTAMEATIAMEAKTAVTAVASAGTALVSCTAAVEGSVATSGPPVSTVATTASVGTGTASTAAVVDIKTETVALETAETTTVVKEIEDKTVAKAVVALKAIVTKTSATVLYYLYMLFRYIMKNLKG